MYIEKVLQRPYIEMLMVGKFYMEGSQSNHLVEEETEAQGRLSNWVISWLVEKWACISYFLIHRVSFSY